jgi:hypothetical protein
MRRSGWRSLRASADRIWRERWWLCAFAALLTLCRLPTIDGWDEAFYTAQLTSVVGDGDLRLQDDVVLVPARFEDKFRAVATILPSGALANTFSLGPALLLSPFTALVVWWRPPPPWLAFRAAAAAGAMVMLTATALLCTAVARRLGARGDLAPLAAGLALLGSPIARYGTRSYLSAHAWGALLVALAVHQALAWVESRGARHALALGLAAGVASVNRWQDVVVVLPVILAAWAAAARDGRPWRPGAGLAAAAAALAVACQLLAFWIQFGTPFLVPQGAGYVRWLAPQVLPLLVSTYHGLVPWAPALALGLLGLALGAWRGPRPTRAGARWLLVALALGSGLAVYVSACPVDWWGRDAYGPRRLASLAPAAAVGLSLLFRRLPPRTVVLLSGLLGLWAAVTLSANFSGHDDLLALFTGRPDPFRPSEAVAEDQGWIDRWGALHALKPGFSLSDAPRLPDRLAGIAFVAAVVALLRLLAPALSRRAGAQRLAVGVALVLVGAWVAVLAIVVPSNRDWNARWASFLAAPLDPVRAASLPADVAVPRDVVVAARAATVGEESALADALVRLRARGVVASRDEALRCRAEVPGGP